MSADGRRRYNCGIMKKPPPVLSSAEIREKFLRFFEERGHQRVPSSPLVPANDPTLLFTNSGMVQFKDVFLGFDKRPYNRAVTAQRCLRAGGKHNDLENVGYTARHHTFFEMLGNFSFGDYFKEKAIPYAWEFLTSPDWLGLSREHLWVTVFGGGQLFGPDFPPVPADEQAAELWEKTLVAGGFSPEEARGRIARIPTADNFWMMGETGPCGPCSEIFYNRNPKAERFEGEDEDKADDCVEVWNLVFMQFNRDDSGALHPLPAPCVDTGMGLERISAVMQGVRGNFETDAFAALNAAVNRAVAEAGGGDCGGKYAPSHYVVADHIRAAAFLIADGVPPSNEGRGYVLRRIIRRALRHGHKLGATAPFFHKIVPAVAEAMAEAHPVIADKREIVTRELAREEKNFAGALARGLTILRGEMDHAKGKTVSGEAAFTLYDTYGFPADLTADVARESGMSVDMEDFEKRMGEQRARSRAAMKFKSGQKTVHYDGAPTEFVGYDSFEAEARVLAVYADGRLVKEASEGQSVVVVLDRTPFYAESGGQVGDTGSLFCGESECIVADTQKLRTDAWGHSVEISKGRIRVDDYVLARVDTIRRESVKCAHSATHLMHFALREILGPHVEQRGSLVDRDQLRFDFSHNAPISTDQLRRVEDHVNNQIRHNVEVLTDTMSYQDALGKGAMALFGEKYGDEVRVVEIGLSIELCGGTHVNRSGNIGYFRFISQSAVAAGIRRVGAMVGDLAVTASQLEREGLAQAAMQLKVSSASLGVPIEEVAAKISQLQEERREAERELEKLRAARLGAVAAQLAQKAARMGGANVVIEEAADVDGKGLRELASQLRGRLESPAAIFLAGGNAMAALVDKELGDKWSAREWIQVAAEQAGAKGGGRADFAQAGGADAAKLEAALETARKWARARG